MPFVVADTDVASLIQKERLPPSLAARLAATDLCISFVILGELAKWAELRSWSERTETRLARWLTGVVVLPYSERVCHVWGYLAAASQRRGRRGAPNDMWIAACCLAVDLPLATLNRKDFADFAEYDGLCLIDS